MVPLAFPLAAQAATTHFVDPSGSSGFTTIGAAVAAAADGDVIVIRQGAYEEPGVVVLAADLELVGEAGERPVLTSATLDGFFRVEGGTVTLRNLAFAGRAKSRAIVQTGGALQVLDCELEGFDVQPSERGGAIRVDAGSFTARLTEFRDNRAVSGGHVHLGPGATGAFERVTLAQGRASASGGAISTEAGATLDVSWSVLDDNDASTNGGGIGPAASLTSTAAVTLSHTLFARNDVTLDGGAVYLGGPKLHHSIEQTLFCSNTADREGGAVFLYDGELTVTRSGFVENTSPEGASVRARYSPIDVVRTTFLRNHGTEGQAIYVANSATDVERSAFVEHVGGTVFRTAPFQYPINLLDAVALYGNDDLGSVDTSNVEVVSDDPELGASDPCDPFGMSPPAGSPLRLYGLGAVTDEDDGDGDGYEALFHEGDCDDRDPAVHPDTDELPADGVDQNCDGWEACWYDPDGDGLGEAYTVSSPDLDCQGYGEASVTEEACPVGDDDGDGVCNDVDVCPTGNDRFDADEDGAPDACDPCPEDPADGCGASPGSLPDRDGAQVASSGEDTPGCGCGGPSRTAGGVGLVLAVGLGALGRRRDRSR